MPGTSRSGDRVADVRNDPITIGRTTVAPGRKARIELPFARLPTGSPAHLPIAVINGRNEGPNVWISGGIHGDEINGVQVVREAMRALDARHLRGAVIAVPIVNPLGFLMRSRYLPDRRDLNRAFPGSPRGSTASRLAHLFISEVVTHCSVGIDCHTASNHRMNIPQIRGDIEDLETRRLATAFGAPFALQSKIRDGSLRQAATEMGITMLVFEGGQSDRFDEEVIDAGVTGIMRTLRALGMIDIELPDPGDPRFLGRSKWIRARRGGLVEIDVGLGEEIKSGQVVARISDAFGVRPTRVKSKMGGWVISRTLTPLVNPGDPLVNIGY